MKPSDIEYWAVGVIARVEAGQPIEDSRVELKSLWVPAEQAARRIAGHANASGGEQILWLIGVDETRGVVGVNHQDLATWWAQVKAEFNELVPAMQDINVPYNSQTVVALLFETDRAPYVVRNIVCGKPGGGPVEREVPWREGTSTRSANRSELVKLLVPLSKLPEVDVSAAELLLQRAERAPDGDVQALLWRTELMLYIVPAGAGRLVIPFHRCAASLEIPHVVSKTAFDSLTMGPPPDWETGDHLPDSRTIAATRSEALVDGPGRLRVIATGSTPSFNSEWQLPASVTLSLLPVGAERPLVIAVELAPQASPQRVIAEWFLTHSLAIIP